MKQNIIEIQWGGYYSGNSEGEFIVFRLLDFTKDAHQAQFFKERFNHLPTFEEIRKLQPYILHVPIATGNLLKYTELALIGHEKLNDQALEGYQEYLTQMEVSDSDINELIKKLIKYSNEEPINLL